MMLFFAIQQADAAEREDDADLHRPENAANRRADGAGGEIGGHRAVAAQEALAGRRLHVGQHVFVRRQPIDILVWTSVCIFNRAQPSAILDHRADEPADHADARADADQEQEPAKTSRIARAPSERADSGGPSCSRRLRSRTMTGSTTGCARSPDAAPETPPASGYGAR